MPKSRFSFAFTFLVAAALIGSFHSLSRSALDRPISILSTSNNFENQFAAPRQADEIDNFGTPTSRTIVPPEPTGFGAVSPNSPGSAVTPNSPTQGGVRSGVINADSRTDVVNSLPGSQGVSNATNGGGGGGSVFDNPLKFDKIEDFLNALLGFVINIGYVVAVFFIILSGFKFVMAQGNPGLIDKAREMLTWTLVGTGVLIGAQVLAQVIKTTISALGAP